MAAKLCNVCNTRRPKTGSKGTETSPHNDMCNYCFEEGGWENTHSDANHDAIAAEVADKGGDPASYLSKNDLAELDFMATCWICHPELNLAQKPAGKSTGPKAQGTRRPQLNHKGHSHPATPAARRACKLAFWAEYAKSGITPENISATPFLEWDYNCDGHGKALPEPKPARLTVVPRGPKGGVINQLKKGNSASK